MAKPLVARWFFCSIFLAAFALPASGFDWKAHQGKQIKLLLNKHPYSDALLYHLVDFMEKTGIKVSFEVVHEEDYFDRVTEVLSSKSSEYAIFMTGAYQIWQYAPQGYMENLRPYMENPDKTNSAWDQADFFENLLQPLSWNLKPGSPLGTPGAPQWALPWGFETNTLVYRKDIFARHGLTPPDNLPELLELCARLKELEPDMIPIVVRGTQSWATIHPGFLSSYAGYGAKDYHPFPRPAMNSPQAIEMTGLWMEMIKHYGPDDWELYTWYDCSKALGNGRAVMMYDADIVGYFQNQMGASMAAGKLAWAPGPGRPARSPASNMWIWALAMNAHAQEKDAAWYFLQWATGKEFLLKGVQGRFSLVDPVRKSIWNSPEFMIKLKGYTNYYETFQTIMPNCRVYFTPQPLFFETTTMWTEALHDMYRGKLVRQTLNSLVANLETLLHTAGYD
ncbi:ABC transporter substrate-binding protein [candidate division KSB3 bacterium]|uniref:ABC transporter substrate-binding protein n=1 Tax=candidate division KSB3 bacterium TaxID=2044937 RepID=A0A2G6KGH7_9BACT|nr:MAG: ABC transporter substrate-binding protein [candidate division KSB3 bacterium]